MSETKNNLQYVVFQIGRETYALNTAYVLRVERDKKIRFVPNTSKEMKGIITVEAEGIVPLVDLRVKFNIESDKPDEIPFIIVSKMAELGIVAGFIVDNVMEVIEIPEDADLSNISESIAGGSTEYIHGIYRLAKQADGKTKNNDEDELLIILNIHKLLDLDGLEEYKGLSK